MMKYQLEYRFQLDTRTIFGDFSQTSEDVENLQRLISEVRYVCKISETTGLRIVRTFWHRNNLCVLTYLGKKLKMPESEKRKLCSRARINISQMLFS
jgi:hypothetical protein